MADNNDGIYSLFQDPVFLMFNSFLHSLGKDFRTLSEHDFNMYITAFAHDIQTHLIRWSEKYHHAD